MPGRTHGLRFIVLLLSILLLVQITGSAAASPTIALEPVRLRDTVLPEGTAGMAAVYVPESGLVYLLGGYRSVDGQREAINDVWAYDPALDELRLVGRLSAPLALAGHVYDPANDVVYLFGGMVPGGQDLQPTDAILAYDINSGVTRRLSNKLPGARARTTATLTPAGIYIAGGVSGDTFSAPINQLLFFDLDDERIEATINLPGDWGTNNVPHYWTALHYMEDSYRAVIRPEPATTGRVEAETNLLILGTHGYARVDPLSGQVLAAERSDDLYAAVAGVSAFFPLKRHLVTAGGYGLQFRDPGFPHCAETEVADIDPRRETHNSLTDAYIPTSGSGDVLNQTQSDAAAVYVPELDRVVVFGGFLTEKIEFSNFQCDAPWTERPAPEQMIDQIYTISPDYYTDYDWSLNSGQGSLELTLLEILNPVAGQPTTLRFYRSDPTEDFAIGIQAPFRTTGGAVEVQTRIIPAQFNPQDPVRVTVVPPEDIVASQSGRRIVAFCILSEERALPANCREAPLTLQPGSLSGTVRADLSGSGGSGVIPAARAIVELRDESGDVVATATTRSDGSFSFCRGSEHCLAVGPYTVQVYRPYEDDDEFIYLPTSVGSAVVAEERTTVEITMDTTEILGPTVKNLDAQHDGVTGDEIGTFLTFDHLPDIDGPEVLNRFSVEPQDFIPQRPTARVRFELPGTGYGNVDRDGSDGWTAEFDMTEVLHAGATELVVTAIDDRGLEGEPRVFPLLSRPAKRFTDTWELGDRGLVWQPYTESYMLHLVTSDRRSPLQWPQPPPQELDFGIVTFYNRFDLQLEIVEDYRIDGVWSSNVAGIVTPESYFRAQVMSVSRNGGFFEHPVTIKALYDEQKVGSRLLNRTIETYRVTGFLDLCELDKLPQCGEWVDMKSTLIYDKPLKDKDGETIADRQIGIGVDMKYEAELRISGDFDGETYRLQAIRVTPRPIVGVQGKVAFTVDAFVASVEVGAGIAGEVGYAQPLVFTEDDFYLDDPCVDFRVYIRLWMTFGALFGAVEETIEWTEQLYSQRFPQGCDLTQLVMLQEFDDFLVPEVHPAPAAAVAEDGSLMRVWVEDADSNPNRIDLVLRYAYANVDGSDSSGTLTDRPSLHDPAVAFLGDGSAIAVWTQIDEMPGPDDGVVDALMSTELYASRFQEGSGWSTPQRLTSNNVSDGRAALAAKGSRATVAWVRDSDGNVNTSGDWRVVSRQYVGGSWQPEEVVDAKPGSADFEPTLAYATDNNAWLVWVRDDDGDLTTLDDRRLAYSRYNALGWTRASQPARWPARAMHPSIAFSPLSGYPLVAMVVSPGGSDSAEATVTVQNRLYAAWRGRNAADWDVQPVGDARGAWPQATIYTDNHALIILRGFGGDENDGEPQLTGQVAVAAGRLDDQSARWVSPGLISASDTTVWQIGAATLPIPDQAGHAVPDGMMSFVAVNDVLPDTQQQFEALTAYAWTEGQQAPVRMAGARRATMLGGNANTGIFESSDPMAGIDPYIESVEISNEQPRPGEIVTIDVTIRNGSLRPMGSTDSTRLSVRLTCQNNTGCQYGTLDGEEYRGDLLFNERLTFSFQYRATGTGDRLRVVIDNHPMDVDNDNNERLITLGETAIPAPGAVRASFTNPQEVEVSWRPPMRENEEPVPNEGYPFVYRVYRSRHESGPWTWIGLTGGNRFVDPLPDDRVQYFYAVKAHDVRGRFSPLSLAVQAAEVSGGRSGSGTLFMPVVRRP